MLLKGLKLGYVSEAMVYHSHNYSLSEEFKRYFDTGIFHKMERLLLGEFGKAEGQGIKYLISEMSFLISGEFFHLLPLSILKSFLKLLGYKLGYHYECLPRRVVRQLSMHREWVIKWQQDRN
jgi:rhamnosyltransferase